MQFGADNAPVDALSQSHVVFSHSQASRSLSKLTRLQMQIVSFRQFHDLSHPGSDFTVHLGRTSDWTHTICTCPCQASMVTWHLTSSAPCHPLPVIGTSSRHPTLQDSQLPPAVGRSSLASWTLPTTRTGPRQPQDVLVPPSLVTREEYCNSLPYILRERTARSSRENVLLQHLLFKFCFYFNIFNIHLNFI